MFTFCRLPFAVNVMLKLSLLNLYGKFIIHRETYFTPKKNVLRYDCCLREELRLSTLVLVRESREFEFGGGLKSSLSLNSFLLKIITFAS